MTANQLYGELRLLIGNPNVQEVNNRTLLSFVNSAMDWLAGKLQFNVKTEERMLSLTASTSEYPLPPDLLSVIWVEWNDDRLEPVSIHEYDRDQSNYRTQEDGTPSSYALQGRTLIILPPPTSANVTTDGTLSIRYIAAATPMSENGPEGLSESDQRLVTYRAAYEWCASKPTEENVARLGAYREIMDDLLLDAKRRWVNPTKFLYPSFTVFVDRQGPAR